MSMSISITLTNFKDFSFTITDH